jgi:hypothetical protein
LELVPIKLLDGRVELAPKSWKSLRFGKGRPIYELAWGDFEAWSGGCAFLNEARLSEIGKLARRLVPGFDVDTTPKTQNGLSCVSALRWGVVLQRYASSE